MGVDLRKIVKNTFFKSFKDMDLQVYYDESIASIKEKTLPKKEFPALTIIPDKNMNTKFIVSNTDNGYYSFTKGNDYLHLKMMMKYVTVKNAHLATNNHVSIYINNPEQLKYLDAIKPLFKNVLEYHDTDGHY